MSTSQDYKPNKTISADFVPLCGKDNLDIQQLDHNIPI